MSALEEFNNDDEERKQALRNMQKRIGELEKIQYKKKKYTTPYVIEAIKKIIQEEAK